MPPPRPRNSTSGAGSGADKKYSASTPMSERQQMALLMQMEMTSSTSPSSSTNSDINPNGNSYPARSRERNERGETALHVAAIKGDQDSTKKLLESGIDPNVVDFAGWTPLHEACNHAHFNVALALIKAGANVNAKAYDDDTPLHDAAMVGNLKLVKLLVEKGADYSFKNRKGKAAADVAITPAVSSYLLSLKDSGASRSQHVKKSLLIDQKKSLEEGDDASPNPSSGASTNKEEVDVYEFKTTSKDNPTGDDSKHDSRKAEKQSTAGGSSSDEKSADEKSSSSTGAGAQGAPSTSTPNPNSSQSKRAYSDVENTEDGNETDENKRKKRKDSENVKDNFKPTNRVPPRQDKVLKQSGNPGKSSGGVAGKVTSNVDRKSPCESPKPVTKSNDSDAETDETKNAESFGSGGGPKVPPLKIVIPQQSSSGDSESGNRNGKSNSTRSHQALPYVVASSNSNDCTATDKDSTSSRCSSPSENSVKGAGTASSLVSDEKYSKATSEERAQQRVLRSSHRSGGQNADRSSNNSSPQMQSSSPSPAPQSTTDNNENPTTKSSTGSLPSASTSSPAGQPSNQLEPENSANAPSPSASSTSSTKDTQQNTVELHPRKRKIRTKQEENTNKTPSAPNQTNANAESVAASSEVHPHDHPFTNCYQMYLTIRKQIEKKHKTILPIQPRPPQGFKDYLMNRRTYVLAGKPPAEHVITYPTSLPTQMKEIFTTQEKERHKLKMQHIVEKEKLGLTVEQEILRVHGKAARSLSCQSLPYSVCTVLKDEEVYNLITPEQEEKDRNARSRYNGRLFLSWLQDVDDKWEKIKEAMVLRHHNEAESLHAVQKMDWEWALKEHALCDYKSQPDIDESFVPMVHVSDDFDLLPA